MCNIAISIYLIDFYIHFVKPHGIIYNQRVSLNCHNIGTLLLFRRKSGYAILGAVPLVQRPGDLIEVASDAPVFGGQLPDGGQQLVIDRGNGHDGADGRAPDGTADKLGLADTVGCKAGGKVGVFLLGHAGLDYSAAVRRVVSFAVHRFQLLSAVSFVNRKTSPQIPKEKTAKSTGLFFNVHKFLMV